MIIITLIAIIISLWPWKIRVKIRLEKWRAFQPWLALGKRWYLYKNTGDSPTWKSLIFWLILKCQMNVRPTTAWMSLKVQLKVLCLDIVSLVDRMSPVVIWQEGSKKKMISRREQISNELLLQKWVWEK